MLVRPHPVRVAARRPITLVAKQPSDTAAAMMDFGRGLKQDILSSLAQTLADRAIPVFFPFQEARDQREIVLQSSPMRSADFLERPFPSNRAVRFPMSMR